MRNKYVQMSLFNTYKDVAASMEEDKPKLFRLLDEHIDWDTAGYAVSQPGNAEALRILQSA